MALACGFVRRQPALRYSWAARAQGYRVRLLDLLFNVVVALVVVAGARAVGTLLVIALSTWRS